MAEQAEAAEKQQADAAVMLVQNLAFLDGFRRSREKEDARLPALRKQTTAGIELAKAGKLKELLDSAGGTLPETSEFLLALPAEHFPTWEVGTVLLGPKARLFLWRRPIRPATSSSLLFSAGEGSQRIERVDAIHYGAMYDLSTVLDEYEKNNP